MSDFEPKGLSEARDYYAYDTPWDPIAGTIAKVGERDIFAYGHTLPQASLFPGCSTARSPASQVDSAYESRLGAGSPRSCDGAQTPPGLEHSHSSCSESSDRLARTSQRSSSSDTTRYSCSKCSVEFTTQSDLK
jgi:hypothetical protein